MRVAPDGRRVYFVASGDLLGPAQQGAWNRQARSTVGADNLYVYDDSGQGTTAFIGICARGKTFRGPPQTLAAPAVKRSDPVD